MPDDIGALDAGGTGSGYRGVRTHRHGKRGQGVKGRGYGAGDGRHGVHYRTVPRVTRW